MLIIGIAGGSGSGKTSVVQKIIKTLPKGSVNVLSQDAYYKDSEAFSQIAREKINFDHPSSIEFSLLFKHIKELKEGKAIHMPTYSYVTCKRGEGTVLIRPAEVLIVEGILIFTSKRLCNILDLKVFVDTGADDRVVRIIQRDVTERGRDLFQSIQHYEKYVKPMHEIFIEPTKKHADIIIPLGGHNAKGIDILTSKIKQTLASEEKTCKEQT